MSETVMPGQRNTESHIHVFSPLFSFHHSNWKTHLVKKPNHLPLYLEMTNVCGLRSPVSAKILLFQYKRKLKHFPLLEATHSCLDFFSLPLRRMFSRAHKFFKGYFCLCLPHMVSFQTFLSRSSGTKWPGEHGFSCTCTKSLPSHSHKLRVSLFCWCAQEAVQDEV